MRFLGRLREREQVAAGVFEFHGGVFRLIRLTTCARLRRCGGRRIAKTAAYLVDEVIPVVPVRQRVLSFPIPLRLLFAAYPELLTPTLAIMHREIRRLLVHNTGVRRGQTGAVTLVQRFGSAADLNIHLHGLVLEGAYQSGNDNPAFHAAASARHEETVSVSLLDGGGR